MFYPALFQKEVEVRAGVLGRVPIPSVGDHADQMWQG